MKQEKETVKIRTKKGMFLTLDILNKDETHIIGIDKYNKFVKLPISDIDSMIPIRGVLV